ncbi:hypothetical protein HAX54_011108 [Datura stramonium]|uniref:Uncharacterized protein n=1 Tax=Datura stramonium TaxID=4076 RepID=A0ABS8THF1_DATST|nr:hypothetical protein [Datura stramonium]
MEKFEKVIFGFILLLLPAIVLGESCDPDDGRKDNTKAFKYKLGAMASILVASAIGVCVPLAIPTLRPEKNFFFIIKAFAAGVILSTGFVHVLPDAFDKLTSSCLKEHPWRKVRFISGFVAMISAIGTLMVDAYANSYYNKKSMRSGVVSQSGDGGGVVHAHSHGHAHASVSVMADSNSELLRYRVISQVLELGIIVHSVIIGIALGASQSPKTIRPLVAALTFHQFFEGMGLGGSIAQAKFKSRGVAIMALLFSLTTPIGIGIGLGITKDYHENGQKALIVEGIFNSASAGILIYMALVDFLAADFMHPRMQGNGKLQLGANISLLLGAGLMSVLAIWA